MPPNAPDVNAAPPPVVPDDRGRRALVFTGLLVLVVGAIHTRDLPYGFAGFDDDLLLKLPALARLTGDNLAAIWRAFTPQLDLAPLPWMLALFERGAFGDSLVVWRVFALVYHLASLLMVRALLVRLFPEARGAVQLAVLGFAAHPLAVESVTWLVGRNTLLVTFFLALSLWLYAGYAARGGWWRYALTWFAALLGVLCKAWGVLVGPGVVLVERFGRGRSWRDSLLRGAPFLLAGLVYGLWASPPQTVGYLGGSLGSSLAAHTVVLARYLGHWVFPGRECLLYAVAVPPAAGRLLLSALVVGGVFGGLYRLGRDSPAARFGLLWYLSTQALVFGFVPGQWWAMADRYNHVGGVGLLLAVFEIARTRGAPWFGGAARRRRRLAALGAGALALVVLVGLSIRQVGTWRSYATIVEHAATLEADGAKVNLLAGHLALMNGDPAGAEALYRRALAAVDLQSLSPFEAKFVAEAALVFHRRGDARASAEATRVLQSLGPGTVPVERWLAEIEAERGAVEAAWTRLAPLLAEAEPLVAGMTRLIAAFDARQGRRVPAWSVPLGPALRGGDQMRRASGYEDAGGMALLAAKLLYRMGAPQRAWRYAQVCAALRPRDRGTLAVYESLAEALGYADLARATRTWAAELAVRGGAGAAFGIPPR